MLVWQHVRSRAVELSKKIICSLIYIIFMSYFDIVNLLEIDFVETMAMETLIIYNGYSHQLIVLQFYYHACFYV